MTAARLEELERAVAAFLTVQDDFLTVYPEGTRIGEGWIDAYFALRNLVPPPIGGPPITCGTHHPCELCGTPVRTVLGLSDHVSTASVFEQIEQLQSALKPFARYAEALPPIVEGEDRITDTAGFALACKDMQNPSGPEVGITFGQIRHALALLRSFPDLAPTRSRL